jgi:lactoylglutathione lyase
MKFIYTGIRVRDLERSVEFYTKAIGMKEIRRGRMRAGGVFVQFKCEDSQQELELNYYPPRSKYWEEYVEGSELDHLAFWCKDIRKDYRRIIAGGATSAIEPWDESGYTLAFVRDPDGVWIELMSRTARTARKGKK